jgi:dephospho-CoA kinase
MFVVGITGGIASGKTFVASLLKDMGAIGIDADKVAREVIVDTQVKRGLAKIFGGNAFTPEGKVDRRNIGKKAFADIQKLKLLNELMLPKIISVIMLNLEHYSKTLPPNQVVVIDAPLLIESGLYESVDMVVYIRAKDNLKLERLLEKGFTIEEAENRIKAQLSDEENKKYADYVINNNRTIEDLEKQTVKLWEKIMRLAAF